MVNNTNEILAQNLGKNDRALMEYMADLVNPDEQEELNINSAEKTCGND